MDRQIWRKKENKKLLETIRSCSPDIIVITGDLVDSNHTNVERAVAFVNEAVKIAPVYYVTGNHEYWLDPSENEQMMQGILAAGACDLDDEAVRIEKGDSSFMLAGLDDQHLSDETCTWRTDQTSICRGNRCTRSGIFTGIHIWEI